MDRRSGQGPGRIGAALLVAAVALVPGAALAQSEPATSFSVGVASDAQHLDPALAYDLVSVPIVRSLFDRLVTYDKDLDLVPSLAAELPTISADGLTYTFTLRPGVQFVQDGQPLREVVADDVVASLNRLLRPDLLPTPSPVGGAFFSGIVGAQEVLDGTAEAASGLKALDDRTVEITLARPDRTFLNALAMTFGSVVPRELATLDGTFGDHPVGSGPFWLKDRTLGQDLHLARNPVYWQEGRPAVDEVEIRFLVSVENQVQQIKDGQLDLSGDPALPTADLNALRDDPAYADQLVLTDQVANQYLAMDTSAPDSPLSDVRVRQAINMAIDKPNLIRIAAGLGEELSCIFPARMPGFDPACNPYPYDLEKAKALMAEAGVAEGFDTQLYTDTTTLSQESANAIAADLAQLGIRAEVVLQDFDVLLGTIQTPHAAPMVLIGWFQDYPDPSDFIDPILSCASAVEGGANVAWFCDPAIDERAAAARQIPLMADAIDEYQAIQRDIMAQAPWVPLYVPVWSNLHSERLTGFEDFDPVYGFDYAAYGVTGG